MCLRIVDLRRILRVTRMVWLISAVSVFGEAEYSDDAPVTVQHETSKRDVYLNMKGWSAGRHRAVQTQSLVVLAADTTTASIINGIEYLLLYTRV